MAIIASFTNVSSSYITTIHELGERKGQIILLDNHFCWKAAHQTLQEINPKAPRKNLKIHLDNILNNLCDTTPRQMFLEAAYKMHSAF